jgi:hypothetical protein
VRLLPFRGVPPEQLTANRTFVAIYDSYDRDRDRPLYAVGPESFEAIMAGYGCGNCLAYFGGLYFPKCPTCGEQTGDAQATHQWWTNYPEKVNGS